MNGQVFCSCFEVLFDILCMLKIVAAIGSYNPLNIYAHVQLV